MLEVSKLKVSYDGVLALSRVDLAVRQGSIVALVGGNGNGKSTTLRTIAGLNKADAGAIRFNGADITAIPAHKRVGLGLSLVPEGRRIFARLSVQRNLELGAYTRSDSTEVAQSIEQMYALFPILKQRRHQLAGTMSGGEQQMLAIGRCLMGQPRLIMFDEPSLGLAPTIVQEVFRIVRRLNEEGLTILLVEQNVMASLEIAHRGYVLENGRIELSGPGRAILSNDRVRQAYLGL